MCGMKMTERIEGLFEQAAGKTSQATGSFWAFALALLAVSVWASLGPLFHYSETWQLVINTATTIITFLMVFVIQHAQNKDTRALHLKLNELIAAVDGASNRLIDVEGLSDAELEHLHIRFQHLALNTGKLAHGAKTSVESEQEAAEEAREKEAKQAKSSQ